MPPAKPERTLDELRADGSVYAMLATAEEFTYAVHRRGLDARDILESLTTDELYRLCLTLAELRTWSQHNGGDIDHVAVERAMDGHKVKLRDVEQVELAKRFIGAGRTRTEFSRILGVSGSYAIGVWDQAQGILAYERHHDTVLQTSPLKAVA